MIYYVDCSSLRSGDGSKEYPFQTISSAAKIAKPGDEVIVAPGVYREYVDPTNAGCEDARITYKSREMRGAVITGSETVKNWVQYAGNVWLARIPNGIFGNYNPYTTLVSGDWYIATYIAHTGDVFLNGKSLYETSKIEGVLDPVVYSKSWDPDFSTYTWYTEQDEETNETLIYANFHGLCPNDENVEITVRRNCFYPSKEGVGYITLSGFVVEKAATQWAPPTAYQEGMVGPHWSKGWIIEDCEIAHSKCSGISLGKYLQPNNDNKWSKWKFKDGTQTERDNICQAQIEGWTKEKIGSHIIRRCDIHDCGQTGIVGHLGGVFSIIEDNHIHHINNKQNLAGAEIGGIKMHAAIDVIIRRNHFHHCTRGLWLDWQAQGTRVTENLFHDNTFPYDYNATIDNVDGLGEDIFIEVSHGPTLVDHNILLSDHALKLPTQGVAFVHNLIAGSMTTVGRGVNNGSVTKISPRYTPYHVHHRTEIAGFMSILHGDMRFYNNIFIQRKMRSGMMEIREFMKDNEWNDGNLTVGTIPYESYPTYEEYASMFEGYCGMGSEPSDRYYVELPVWSVGNAFFNGAKPMKKDKNAIVDNENEVSIRLEEKDGVYSLYTNVYEYLKTNASNMVSTNVLGMAFEPEQYYENPDGTPIVFDTDYFGNHRAINPMTGPFEEAAYVYVVASH
ncbi:MAG: right-handed parallel beta-helix repeat-containing protein [Eubacteriales bacterium]|nr:right-handed parallel beta-helix repeat-containing protein [Lachnospiraceae bacterium]MDO5127726.1 right-handed parallel beta-helix repeat-containing protein [Eubacteriales bacterium]